MLPSCSKDGAGSRRGVYCSLEHIFSWLWGLGSLIMRQISPKTCILMKVVNGLLTLIGPYCLRRLVSSKTSRGCVRIKKTVTTRRKSAGKRKSAGIALSSQCQCMRGLHCDIKTCRRESLDTVPSTFKFGMFHVYSTHVQHEGWKRTQRTAPDCSRQREIAAGHSQAVPVPRSSAC